MRAKPAVVMIAILGGLSVSAHAQTTKWVDQVGGSDANDGNTEATAYASLQWAIDNSVNGVAGTPSVINVKDGAYQKPGQVSAFGYATGILITGFDYLTIQGVPGHEPSAQPLTGLSIAIDFSNHVIIENIDLDGSLAGFDRMHVRDSTDVTVRNCVIEFGVDGIDAETDHTTFLIENNVFRGLLTGEAIDFSDGAYDDITIQDNLFEADNRRPILIRNLGAAPIGNFTIRRNMSLGTSDQEAIRVIGADNVLIENNVIMNSRQQGLYIDTNLSGGSPSSNITVQHNTFFNSDQEGAGQGEVRTKVFGPDIVIKNNILHGNGSNPAIETATILPGEDFNLVFNDVTPGFTFGPNDIFADPLFVSTIPGSEDLHLTDGSLAIETGTDLGVPDDKDKGIRPNPSGTNPDMGAYEFFLEAVLLPLDIKPGSCPNSFNPMSKGVLPVALVGTEQFNVIQVDLDSLLLSRADGGGSSVAPLRSSYEDVATPFPGEPCACHELTGDGVITDLSLKFKSTHVVSALQLADFGEGDLVELRLSGVLFDGTPFVAYDCIRIVQSLP